MAQNSLGPDNGTGNELVPQAGELAPQAKVSAATELGQAHAALVEEASKTYVPYAVSGIKPETRGRARGSLDGRKRRAYSKRSKRPAVMLPEPTVQHMFDTYCTAPNHAYVARTCGVNASTVRRYAHDLDFEGRRQKVLEEARKKADYTLVKATSDSLLMLRALKGKIAQKINSIAAQSLNTDSIVTDFERLVKLEQVLLGGVADRTEHQLTTHEERIRKLREERVLALPGRTN